MCTKTCKISNLFCTICLVVDLAGGQPITPFNYLSQQGQRQIVPEQSGGLVGMEQIRPVSGPFPGPYHPGMFSLQNQRYGQQIGQPPISNFGGMPMAGSNRQQELVSQIMRQQQLQQQQSHRLQSSAFRGGFGSFPPPSFGQPINGQAITASHSNPQIGLSSPFLVFPPSPSFLPHNGTHLGGRGDPQPDIPTEIVIGRQMSEPVQAGPGSTPYAFGSPLATGDSLSPDQFLQSVNAVERTSTVSEGSGMPQRNPQLELPKFLQGAPAEAVDAFKRIIREPNLKYEDQVKRINEMVSQKLDPEHQELYKEFMRENDEREEKHRERIHRTVAQMSAKAQEQFAKISAILRSPGGAAGPEGGRWDRVLNIYARMDPDLRNEFENQFKNFGSMQTFL